MLDSDVVLLTELVTELGKDVVTDWAIGATASVVTGAVVGSVIPGAGNAVGAATGFIAGSVNAIRKIGKAKKYINTSKKIVDVSKKIISKNKTDFIKDSEKWLKHSKNNPFSPQKNASEIDAKNINIEKIKETLDNAISSSKKSLENIYDWCKEGWESAMRGWGKTSSEYMQSNMTSLGHKFNKIDEISKNIYPHEF